MSDTTTVWVNQHRISLLSDSFGLSFHPAKAEDSGDYICLVNSRPKPDSVVRLVVQGKSNNIYFRLDCTKNKFCSVRSKFI